MIYTWDCIGVNLISDNKPNNKKYWYTIPYTYRDNAIMYYI